MRKSALELALQRLEEDEVEVVRKLWRVQKQIEREERKLKRRNVFILPK